jgi:serine/threonine-protein kinase HipA
MKRCLLTYEPLAIAEENYSQKGLKTLSKTLSRLEVFPYSQEEQIEIARKMVKKISIQGVQPKFSVILSLKDQAFKEVENNGKYILKPQVSRYKLLPENEDLTMHLVSLAGMNLPWHGLLKCADGSLSYVIKRFDRAGKEKIPMEDFTQLIGASRDTKYDVPTEKVAEAIEDFCTFPTVEYLKLYKLILLAFLLGNEDLHLKNLSLVTIDNKVQLSPVYDFVNSTIINPNSEDELALSIADKKKGFTRSDFIEGFAVKTLFLNKALAEKELTKLISCLPQWKKMVEKSFLSAELKKRYLALLDERAARLITS